MRHGGRVVRALFAFACAFAFAFTLALSTPVSQNNSELSSQACWTKTVDSPEAGKSLWIGPNRSDNVSRYQSTNTTKSVSIAICPPTLSLGRILQKGNGHESSQSMLAISKAGKLERQAKRLGRTFWGRGAA
jgi:hypothetical protein